jgi:heat shock protein HslJ
MKIAFPGILALALTAILPGALSSSPTGPEDVEWRLLMLGDMPAPALPGGRQVHLLLDSAQKKAAGFAGCNRFFGSYELDGPALGFRPLAATRMACPDTESTLETGFLDALARTRGWKIEAGELLLVDDGTVLARLAAGQGGPSDAVLESLTLHSKVLRSGPVMLAHGEYRATAAPGSASGVTVRLTDMRAFGILNDMQAGALIINTSTGGTGTFQELTLLSRTAEGWTNTDTLLLGDRVQVHSVAIAGGEIVVSMKTHAPRDPRCCPTQEVQQRFAVRDNRLVPVPGTASTSRELE